MFAALFQHVVHIFLHLVVFGHALFRVVEERVEQKLLLLRKVLLDTVLHYFPGALEHTPLVPSLDTNRADQALVEPFLYVAKRASEALRRQPFSGQLGFFGHDDFFLFREKCVTRVIINKKGPSVFELLGLHAPAI